jgi:hypothetical protein
LPEPASRAIADRQACIDVELDPEIRRLVEHTTSAQGLPFRVKDAAVLARVATLLQAVNGRGVGCRWVGSSLDGEPNTTERRRVA